MNFKGYSTGGLIRLFNTLKNLFVSFAEPKGNKTEKTVEGAIRPPPLVSLGQSPLALKGS